MNQDEKQRILTTIERLASGQSEISAFEAEKLLMSVLSPLLKEDGFELQEQVPPGAPGNGIDFTGIKPATEEFESCKLGIQFKYYRTGRPIPAVTVRELMGAALLNEIDRAILLVNTQFSRGARETARRELPFQIELIDLDALRTWAARLEVNDPELVGEVHRILKVVSSHFASLIAANPDVLEELEWRDLERTVAEVFDGIGFKVELTPSSQDGEKDVVLECVVEGQKQIYFVEIKHWRSRNRVGGAAVRDFLNVIVRERTEGGLFLSTYGFCDNAFEQLSEIDRQRIRFGAEEKVVALCRTYVKAKSGLWSPPEKLAEVLYQSTQ